MRVPNLSHLIAQLEQERLFEPSIEAIVCTVIDERSVVDLKTGLLLIRERLQLRIGNFLHGLEIRLDVLDSIDDEISLEKDVDVHLSMVSLIYELLSRTATKVTQDKFLAYFYGGAFPNSPALYFHTDTVFRTIDDMLLNA